MFGVYQSIQALDVDPSKRYDKQYSVNAKNLMRFPSKRGRSDLLQTALFMVYQHGRLLNLQMASEK